MSAHCAVWTGLSYSLTQRCKYSMYKHLLCTYSTPFNQGAMALLNWLVPVSRLTLLTTNSTYYSMPSHCHKTPLTPHHSLHYTLTPHHSLNHTLIPHHSITPSPHITPSHPHPTSLHHTLTPHHSLHTPLPHITPCPPCASLPLTLWLNDTDPCPSREPSMSALMSFMMSCVDSSRMLQGTRSLS